MWKDETYLEKLTPSSLKHLVAVVLQSDLPYKSIEPQFEETGKNQKLNKQHQRMDCFLNHALEKQLCVPSGNFGKLCPWRRCGDANCWD